MRARYGLIPLLLLLAGCSGSPENLEDPASSPSHATQALESTNGENLNGENLNGENLNGQNLSGGPLSQFLVSVSFNGAQLAGGTVLDSAALQGTTFVGSSGGTVYQGTDFLQAVFQGNLGDGSQVPVRIAGMAPASSPNADLTEYDIQYLGSDQQWHPACRDYTSTPVQALPLNGHWDYRSGVPGGGARIDDPTTFTFACEHGAIAKCALWGYRPWATVYGRSLAPYHQACTRMVRADYCGDGKTYTRNGNRIDLYDNLGLQRDTDPLWLFEAEWDQNGARCLSPLNRSQQLILVPCYGKLLNLFCGLNPSSLLFDKTPTGGLTP